MKTLEIPGLMKLNHLKKKKNLEKKFYVPESSGIAGAPECGDFLFLVFTTADSRRIHAVECSET